ncbi:MAG: hypothetical protein JWN17_329, partial [Frankiales bacterium]|nr:hypothetical protein [Frankiales bacterium]
MDILTDDDLLHLLAEAGASYEVPDDGADRAVEALEDDVVVPLLRRRRVQLAGAAAVVAVAVALGVGVFGGDDVDRVGQLAGAAPAATAAPKALENLQLGYDPRSGTLDTRDSASKDGALSDLLHSGAGAATSGSSAGGAQGLAPVAAAPAADAARGALRA